MAENIVAVCCDRTVFRMAYAVCLRLLKLSQGKYDVLLVTEDNPDLARLDVPDGIRIHIPEPGTLVLDGAETHTHGYATYWRLFLPAIVGDECERIVYVDYDVAPLKTLAPLFDLDLGGRLIAAVSDFMACYSHLRPEEREAWNARMQSIGMPASDEYFNSGLLVMDVKGWREAKIMPALSKIAAQLGPKVRFADQDILNPFFHGRWAALSPAWNFAEPCMGAGLEDVLPTVLLHFWGTPKPWLRFGVDLQNGPCAHMAEIYKAANWPDTIRESVSLQSAPVSTMERIKVPIRRLLGFLPRYRKHRRALSVKRAYEAVRMIRLIRSEMSEGRYIDVEQGISRIDPGKLAALEERLVADLGPLAPMTDPQKR